MITIPLGYHVAMPHGGQELRMFRVDLDLILAKLPISAHDRLSKRDHYLDALTRGANDPANADIRAHALSVVEEYLASNPGHEIPRKEVTRITR